MNASSHPARSALPLLTTVLTLGIVVSTWQALRAGAATALARTEKEREAGARQVAEANEQLALSQRDESQSVLEFIQAKVLGAAWNKGTFNKGTTLRQAVDSAALAIDKEFADCPLVEAAARNVFATAYQQLSEPSLAIGQLERAQAIRKATLGPKHPATLSMMNNLAVAYRNAGQLDQAVTLMEETLRVKREVLGAEHPDTFLGLANLALAYHEAGRTREALVLWEEALNLQIAYLGLAHPDTLGSMGQLAVVHRSVADYDRATALMTEAICRWRALAAEFPDNAEYKSRLAALLKLQAEHFGQNSDNTEKPQQSK